MVGFRVGNTLSESGTVARGICSTDAEGHLTTVVERTEIMRVDGTVSYKDEEGKWVGIADNTPVSATVKVLDTTSRWFGVTYAADRQSVVDKFKALADSGEYPSPLF